VAVVRPTIYSDSIVSLGPLVGGSNSKEWLDGLNSYLALSGGGTVFAQNLSGDLRAHYDLFYERVILPNDRSVDIVTAGLKDLNIKPLDAIVTHADLAQGVPLRMQELILADPAFGDPYREGVYHGWGFPKDKIPAQDFVKDVASLTRDSYDSDTLSCIETRDGLPYFIGTDEVAVVKVVNEWHYDDEVTVDENLAVLATKEFLDRIARTTRYDPTNYPAKRGRIKQIKKK
jgi:hypothetical protein